MELHKAKAKVQREAKVKAKKETVQKAGSEKEEGLRKCGLNEPIEITETVGLYLMEHGTQWMVKEGIVCDSCEKKEKVFLEDKIGVG